MSVRHLRRGRSRALVALGVLLALGLGATLVVDFVPSAAQAGTAPPLLGDWNFASGSGVDLTGNWPDFTLVGTAAISGQGLVVTGSGNGPDAASGWAYASGYSGPPIVDKTLVAWLRLDSLTVSSGSPLGLFKPAGNTNLFDSLDYAEREPNEWMAGSDFFQRTQDFSPGEIETAGPRTTLQIAISYQGTGGGFETISGCLNGVPLGSYSTGDVQGFDAADQPLALFGPRHEINGGTPMGSIDAHILESRIYGGAMSCTQVSSLTPLDGAASVSVSLGPPSIVGNGTSTSVATATVTDSYGDPVTGDTVAFSSSDSGEGVGPVKAGGAPGTYQSTITSSAIAGTATITASDSSDGPSVSGAATLTQTAPTIQTAPPVGTASPSNAFTITAVQDGADGAVILALDLPGAGTVDLLGTHEDVVGGVARVLEPGPHRFDWGRASAAATKAGTLEVKLEPDGNGRKLLARHRRYGWALNIAIWATYVPAGGLARSKEIRVRVLNRQSGSPRRQPVRLPSTRGRTSA
jgi:hypothetical protein